MDFVSPSMGKKGFPLYFLVAGVIFILIGIAFFLVYSMSILPEKKAEILLKESQLLLGMKDKDSYRQAISKLNTIITTYTNTNAVNRAHFMLGEAYEKLGLLDKAYSEYKNLYHKLANQKRLSETDRLIMELKIKLATLKGFSVYKEEGISELMSLLSNIDSPDLRARIYYNIGRIYLKAKDYKKAIRSFKIAIREDPDFSLPRRYLAKMYEIVGKYDKALSIYEESAYSSLSKVVDTATIRKKALEFALRYKNKSPYKAIQYFSYIYRNYPTSKEADISLYYVGDIYFSLKRYKKAIIFFKKVIENGVSTKYDEKALFKLGVAYFELEKYRSVIKYLTKLIENYPDSKLSDIAKKIREDAIKELTIKEDVVGKEEGE